MVLRFEQDLLDVALSPTDYVPDDFELVDGQLVEKPMGAESDTIALSVGSLLKPFVRQNKLGQAFGSQTGYRCFPHEPKRVRKPDVSFVALDRMEGGVPPKGDFTIAPDLAVEVVSPHDLYEDLEAKVQDYLKAGVKLIWIISPGSKTVLIRRLGGSCAALAADGELSGEQVLPGFVCKVADLFA